MKILFVCTGNICRSPTADGVMRHLVSGAGLSDQIIIDGAGIQSYHEGDPPDPRTVAEAHKNGVDLSSLRARSIRQDDFEYFDRIFAMDQGHYRHLKLHAPDTAKDKIEMFINGQDVPDPWYGSLRDFKLVYDMIETRCQQILQEIS